MIPLLIRRSNGLAVQDRRCGARLTPGPFPVGHHQRVVDAIPYALTLPTAEVVVDRQSWFRPSEQGLALR